MTSIPTRVLVRQIEAIKRLHPGMPIAEAVRLRLDMGIQVNLVEPFPAPTSPQERPAPADVSAHDSGRQDGLAGLSLPGRGTE